MLSIGLEETRDELQAAAAVQAGRELLMLNPCSNGTEKGPSLAAELLAGMNQDQVCSSSDLLSCKLYRIMGYKFYVIIDGWSCN